jgi:lipoate-protein ligase A
LWGQTPNCLYFSNSESVPTIPIRGSDFPMTWELITDGPLDGLTNMTIDAALLAEVESSTATRTILRFYQWRRPTISLGRNQKIEKAVDVEYCEANGIDIVYRPTGGRAVLHDDELTYSVISNDSSCFGDTIYGNYRRVSEALCIGYKNLGVAAILAPDTRKPNISENDSDPPCFLSASRYELMVEGRKIAGSAQRRVRDSFLQHGSMPITCDYEALALATRMRDVETLKREMAGVADFLPERPPIDTLRSAFVHAFQGYFSIEFRLRIHRPVDPVTA